jgi:hypothetical protein
MQRRTFSFASLALMATGAGHSAQLADNPFEAIWTHRIEAGVLIVELALTNRSKKTVYVKSDNAFNLPNTMQVSVGTGRTRGDTMARVIRYEYVNLVLLPTQSPVIQSRVMPLSPYRGVAADAMLNLGQYRFTVPEEFSKSQMAASARVQTAKGELTFQTTLN